MLASGQKVNWAIKDNKVILTVTDKYVGGTESLAFRLEISDKERELDMTLFTCFFLSHIRDIIK